MSDVTDFVDLRSRAQPKDVDFERWLSAAPARDSVCRICRVNFLIAEYFTVTCPGAAAARGLVSILAPARSSELKAMRFLRFGARYVFE